MIIDYDMIENIKMDISFKKKMVSWEGIEIPICDFNRLSKWKINELEVEAIIQEMR